MSRRLIGSTRRRRPPRRARLIGGLAIGAALAACASVGGGARGTGSGRPPDPHGEIAAMMARSAAAWNRGDLDAFIEDYEASDATSYIGRSGIVHGRAAIRAAYAHWFAPGAARDSLSFEGLEVDALAPGLANVIAFYLLKQGDRVTARGPTSLLMRNRDGRWRIVHDHSS